MAVRFETPTVISETGYQICPGAGILAAVDQDADFTEFAAQWDTLPPDPYLTGGEPFRFRRHAKVVFDAEADEMTVLPHGDYLQAAENNSLFGGISRRFAPVDWTPSASRLISALVRISVARIIGLPGRTLVNLHQVRIVGGHGHAGTPVPEGRHHDGFDFISIHLIGRDVDGGGETSLYRGDEGSAITTTLAEPMDAVYVDDRLYCHDTSPIIGADRVVRRDVLLMSYERASA